MSCNPSSKQPIKSKRGSLSPLKHGKPSIQNLPLEIISRINTFLSIQDYFQFTSSCKSFQFLDCYDGRRYGNLQDGLVIVESDYANYGHIKCCEAVCRAGLSKQSLGRELLKAAEYGRLDFCTLLYSYGADLNFTDNMIDLITPLVFAALADYNVCEFLLLHGANVEAPGSELSPLAAACGKNLGDICILLIKNGGKSFYE
jgi:hypothetical protein